MSENELVSQQLSCGHCGRMFKLYALRKDVVTVQKINDHMHSLDCPVISQQEG